MFKLRSANKSDFEKGIKLSKFCITHRQAIQAARDLNYDFIWIDALCIMQDDIQDWATQASQVPEIYNNADLTIVAGRSNDAGKGFFKSEYVLDNSDVQLPYRCSENSTLTNCWLVPARNQQIGPTTNRGWCYQEALMPRRMVIYGEQQLIFRCREREEYEDGTCMFVGKADTWYNLLFSPNYNRSLPPVEEHNLPWKRYQLKERPARYNISTDTGKPRLLALGSASDTVLNRWYSMTAEFSSRSFYDPRDNHAALSGLVRLFQKVLRERFGPIWDTYVAGLWQIDMICGLLWRSRRIVDPNLPALQAPEHKGHVVRRAPSWSWMALVGPIYQGAGTAIVDDRGFSQLGVPCCKPISMVRESWNYEMIKPEYFPDPLRLMVMGYIRKVRISKYETKDHTGYSTWRGFRVKYNPEALDQHTFRLETEENTALIKGLHDPSLDWPQIAATGLFDMDYTTDRPLSMWALRLTSEEGLLLRQIEDPESNSFMYERLGIFVIENPLAFYPKGLLVEDYTGSYVIEDQLPVETVILV
jgi:hypothetical protein